MRNTYYIYLYSVRQVKEQMKRQRSMQKIKINFISPRRRSFSLDKIVRLKKKLECNRDRSHEDKQQTRIPFRFATNVER